MSKTHSSMVILIRKSTCNQPLVTHILQRKFVSSNRPYMVLSEPIVSGLVSLALQFVALASLLAPKILFDLSDKLIMDLFSCYYIWTI